MRKGPTTRTARLATAFIWGFAWAVILMPTRWWWATPIVACVAFIPFVIDYRRRSRT